MTSVILGRFALQRGELLRLDLGRQVGLQCHRGRMLVTTGGSGRDHELRPGDSLQCGKGLVLVEGPGELLVKRDTGLFWPGRERIELITPQPA